MLKKITTAAVSATFLSATFAVPVSAQDATPFACDPGFYQVISGQLAEFNPGTGEYKAIGEDSSNYNAIGYRLEDGLLYGIRGNALYRIDAEGTLSDLGQLPVPSGAYTGDFGDDGLLHISSGGRNWHKVNVDTLEATPVPELSQYSAVADITNVHGKFYGSSSDGTLYIFDPVALTVTTGGAIANLPEQLKAYGAAWSTAGGNLYVGRNSGEIYQITGFSTGSPVATQVGTATATNSNDGASCSLAAVPAGLNDVDGPEPETEPSTPEAILATQKYVEAFEEISQTFAPVVTNETPTENAQVVINTTAQNQEVEDAGIGTGASCGATIDEDRPQRYSLENPVRTDTAVSLYSSDFDTTELSAFKILSGSWTVENGSLVQRNTCGFDYTTLLQDYVVENFRLETTFKAVEGENRGGIVFHQSAIETRSGAILVDLAENGTVIRWGAYDQTGYYKNIGSAPLPEAVTTQSVTVAAEVHGQNTIISVNGQEMGTFETESSAGMVGLVTSESTVAFENISLTALPAS